MVDERKDTGASDVGAAEGKEGIARSVTASQSFVAGAVRRTGVHRLFRPVRGLTQLWAALGLMLGRRLALVLRDDHVFLIVMAAVVGVTSGAAAALLLAWIDYAVRLFPHPEEESAALRWTVVMLVPVVGGLLAGALRIAATRLVPEPPATGIPAIVEAIAKRSGMLRGRGAAITGLGTGLTIGSGGSCGHEGPSVAIGAAVGSAVARFFGLRLRRHLAMVGAGCAGGLAAAFNAPLAGVIFTIELVFGGAIGGNIGTMSVFIPLIVAAVSGTFTAHAIFGDHSAFDMMPHADASIPDFGFYVLLAIAAGVVGTATSRIIVEFGRRFEKLDLPVWLKPAAGALGVGLLAAIVSNELLGAGHHTVERALHGSLPWMLALVLLVFKIFATALTLGSGGFGGVFMPGLYIGACLGTLVGTLAGLALGPEAQGSTAYALVGMGAIFAAMMHAPLTPIVMLFELTHDYSIILPLMLSCILAVVVAKRINPASFYKILLQRRGVILRHEVEGEVMKRGLVRERMLPPGPVLTPDAGLEEIRRHALRTNLESVFVVDEEGAIIGLIDGHQLAERMLRGEIKPSSTAMDLMGQSRLTLLYPHDSLAAAMLAFARSGQDVLAVVDSHRHLQGVLRRGDLIALYADKVLGEEEEVVRVHSAEPTPDQEVGLGKGLVLERIVVGRAWAGRSLAELELRTKHGVTVLEWTRSGDVLFVDPHHPLREGDELAVCGQRDQLLRARALS